MSNTTNCIQSNELIIDILGYTGAVIFTVVMLPQLIKSFKTKSTLDISWFCCILNTIGGVIYLAYGFLLNQLPMIITNMVYTLSYIILIGLKINHKDPISCKKEENDIKK